MKTIIDNNSSMSSSSPAWPQEAYRHGWPLRQAERMQAGLGLTSTLAGAAEIIAPGVGIADPSGMIGRSIPRGAALAWAHLAHGDLATTTGIASGSRRWWWLGSGGVAEPMDPTSLDPGGDGAGGRLFSALAWLAAQNNGAPSVTDAVRIGDRDFEFDRHADRLTVTPAAAGTWSPVVVPEADPEVLAIGREVLGEEAVSTLSRAAFYSMSNARRLYFFVLQDSGGSGKSLVVGGICKRWPALATAAADLRGLSGQGFERGVAMRALLGKRMAFADEVGAVGGKEAAALAKISTGGIETIRWGGGVATTAWIESAVWLASNSASALPAMAAMGRRAIFVRLRSQDPAAFAKRLPSGGTVADLLGGPRFAEALVAQGAVEWLSRQEAGEEPFSESEREQSMEPAVALAAGDRAQLQAAFGPLLAGRPSWVSRAELPAGMDPLTGEVRTEVEAASIITSRRGPGRRLAFLGLGLRAERRRIASGRQATVLTITDPNLLGSLLFGEEWSSFSVKSIVK